MAASFKDFMSGVFQSASGLSTPATAECAPYGMTPIDAEPTASGKDASGISRPPPVEFGSGLKRTPTNLGPYANQHGPHGVPENLVDPEPVAPGHNVPQQKTWDGRSNPGPFDKADADAMRILKPDVFDGCRFEHNKPLGQQFNVSHSLWLGSAMLPLGNTYQFGSTLILNKGRTMVIGRMSDDMRLDAQVHHEIVEPQRMVARVISSIGDTSDQSVTHATLEANGIDYNASLKLAKGPLYAVSYFQSVTKWLNMGAEAFFHAGQGVSHVFGRANAKLNNETDIITGTISTMGAANMSYVRKVSDRVSLAAELDYNFGAGQTTMNVGYEFLLRQSKISGVISTDGTIQNSITEAIAPGFHIIFNSILDHQKDTHRFGYGVQIG